MELRDLQYFLAVAREESITGAAAALHMTQPPLSRQMKALEEELGKQLFVRGSRKIVLTQEGMILRRRAEEMVELMEKATLEVRASEDQVTGELHIGGGESKGFRLLAATAQRVKAENPGIRYHLYSGNAEDVSERLDRGLLDIGLLLEPADIRKYDSIKLPVREKWGLLIRRDHPLAQKRAVRPEDMQGLPLLASRQSVAHNELSGWLGRPFETLDITATYNLIYNASLMVEAGIGCAMSLEGLVPEYEGSPLCFRPLEPETEISTYVVWKKYQILSRPAAVFLKAMQEQSG